MAIIYLLLTCTSDMPNELGNCRHDYSGTIMKSVSKKKNIYIIFSKDQVDVMSN